MVMTRDAGDVHEEKVREVEERTASCDACGRRLSAIDLVAWDTSEDQEAVPSTDVDDVVWLCRCCRDDGVGRCENCGRLVPAEDLIHVGPSFGVPEGHICTEC